MNILNALELQDHSLVEENDQLRAQVDDLAALVRRLAWVLKKWNKNSELCESATDYLKRAGLVSVLREDDQPALVVGKSHHYSDNNVNASAAQIEQTREWWAANKLDADGDKLVGCMRGVK